MIYLDNNATTRVADEVLAAMTPYYRDHYGNAHSAHTLGRRAHEGVEEARRSVAALLDCDPSEVIFTSCGTEGNAMTLRGLLENNERRKVVTTSVEHPSVMTLLRALEARGQIELAVAPVDSEGVVAIDVMEKLIDKTTLLVSIMQAQNETGVIHPVARVAEIAHRHGAVVHVDSVQAAGKIPVSVRDLGADFLTISGHKFHAPKGVGALVVKRGHKIAPLWYGGGQELGLRSGTEPVPSLVALGVAAEMARQHLPRFAEVQQLRDRFEAAVAADDVSINGRSQPRLGNTASVSFHDTPGDGLVLALDAEGVCVSAGAACHSGKVEPTATMKAMGKPLRVAMGTVRFSLSRYTTSAEIDEAINTVNRVRARV
jgi:cysteine desulfurase